MTEKQKSQKTQENHQKWYQMCFAFDNSMVQLVEQEGLSDEQKSRIEHKQASKFNKRMSLLAKAQRVS